MEERTLWIMGLGPVVVHKQFTKDIGRRNVDWYINNKAIPWDKRDALLLVYEECGDKYFIISKYLSQTMGNMMYEHVSRMHWNGPIVPIRDTYIIKAYSKTYHRVHASIDLNLLDHKLRPCATIHVSSVIDIDKNQTRIRVNHAYDA